MSQSLDDMYDEHILDHFESPYHKGLLDAPTCSHSERNPICGDAIQLQLAVADGAVDQAWFSGKGCAISQAAASILCEHIEGKSLAELKQLQAGDMLKMLKVPLTASRQKCGLLSFKVLKTLLYSLDAGPSAPVNTVPTGATALPTALPTAPAPPA